MSDSAHSAPRKGSGVRHQESHEQSARETDAAIGREQEILSLLSRVVRRDIVPNLITANRVIGAEARADDSGEAGVWYDGGFNAERAERDAHFVSNQIRMVDVARFVRLLRGTGADAAPALVEVLLARGIPRSELYLELLGPAARMIGDMWLDDECSFAEVTMVVARLHQILNGLREERTGAPEAGNAPSILLSVAPGEQHSFGIAVVEAFFQEAGWRTKLSHTNDAEILIEMVSEERFDAIGLSLSHDELGDVLRATILRLRAQSVNRDVVVLVGGPAFQAAPALFSHIGADAIVSAGAEGAVEALKLLPRQRALYV